MADVAFTLTEAFVTAGCCITCGVTIVLPSGLKARLLETQKNFYCCNGHAQHFVGETELDKTKRLLETERRWRQQEAETHRRHAETLSRSRDAYKGKVTLIKNRVGNGVCPCCNRTFQNLLKHMATKHPEFKSEEP
jgi:hypothetical protein